ncbi:hypothetical protein [Microseira wollei]
MFSLIHFLESFDFSAQLKAFIAVPKPYWLLKIKLKLSTRAF